MRASLTKALPIASYFIALLLIMSLATNDIQAQEASVVKEAFEAHREVLRRMVGAIGTLPTELASYVEKVLAIKDEDLNACLKIRLTLY